MIQRMQVFLFSKADAEGTLSDSGCRIHSIKHRMQDSQSDSRCSTLSIRQRMQESFCDTADAGLYQTADTVISLSDIDCRGNLSDIRCKSICNIQKMQASLYQTAGAEVSLSDSGCRAHFIGSLVQESL